MNKLLLLIITIASIVGLWHFRSKQRAQLERVQVTEAALTESSQRAEYAEQRQQALRDKVVQLDAERLSRPASATPASAAAAPEPAGSKFLRDPEMRAALKKQNLKAMERTSGQIVNSNLIAALGLDREQAAALKALVLKKNEPAAELLMALMSGDATDAELAQLSRAHREHRDKVDGEIRAVLGNDGFAAFSWHEDSLPERSRLNEYRGKFTEAGADLTAEQEDALLHAMYEERMNFHFTHDFHDPSEFDPDRLAEIYSEENLNRFIEEMEQVNNNIILRAQSILGTEQAVQFAQVHREHFERSRMTVKMTTALFPVRKRQ